MLLCAPSLFIGLRVDDYWHASALLGGSVFGKHLGPTWEMFRFADGDPERTLRLMDRGILPWWTWPEIKVNFWRPVTVATHWIDHHVWPSQHWLMHLHSLAWFGVLVGLAAMLYRRVMGVTWVTALAALLYAIDDAHAIPASWLANRNAVVAGAFAVGAILLHIKSRDEDSRWLLPCALASLAAGLMAKEEAIAACGYIVAYAVFLDNGTRRGRILSVAPYVLLVVIWRVIYSQLDYGAYGSGIYVDPARHPLDFAECVVTRLPVLFLGQWSIPSSDAYLVARLRPALLGGGILLVGVLGFVLWPLLRKDTVARFWCTGMLLSSIPLSAAFPGDRLLTYVGLGAMGLCAQLLAMWLAKLHFQYGRARKWVMRLLCPWLVFVHLVVAPVAMVGWIIGFDYFGRRINHLIDSAPLDASVQGKTLIIANAPTIGASIYLGLKREHEGLPVPDRIYNLAPNVFFAQELAMTRLDDRTVRLETDLKYEMSLFRDKKRPLHVGDVVELSQMAVTVEEITPEGYPRVVRFTFDRPLEAPDFVWLEAVKGEYEDFTPPPIGATIELGRPRNGPDERGHGEMSR